MTTDSRGSARVQKSLKQNVSVVSRIEAVPTRKHQHEKQVDKVAIIFYSSCFYRIIVLMKLNSVRTYSNNVFLDLLEIQILTNEPRFFKRLT